jgi:hypothetical protein
MTIHRGTLALALTLATLLGAATWQCAAEKPGGAPTVTIDVNKSFVEFRSGSELVSRYFHAPAVAKPFFWPLNAPGTASVTRGWPMEQPEPGELVDHIHQKSAWFCHGDVIPEGMKLRHKVPHVEGVDFWAEQPGSGRIVCVRVGDAEVHGNHGRLTTLNEWRTADNVKVLDETRVLHFHDFGEARLFVLDVDLHASVTNLVFGDTKEGSMGVRVRTSVTESKGKGRITNAEGKAGEKQAWGLQSAWCDYSGPVEGKTAGITLFADPSNPNPSCWHCRGYGLMAANPFGRNASGFPAMKGKTDLVKLPRGEHLKLRYGIFLHAGDVEHGKVAEYYERFTKLKS